MHCILRTRNKRDFALPILLRRSIVLCKGCSGNIVYLSHERRASSCCSRNRCPNSWPAAKYTSRFRVKSRFRPLPTIFGQYSNIRLDPREFFCKLPILQLISTNFQINPRRNGSYLGCKRIRIKGKTTTGPHSAIFRYEIWNCLIESRVLRVCIIASRQTVLVPVTRPNRTLSSALFL